MIGKYLRGCFLLVKSQHLTINAHSWVLRLAVPVCCLDKPSAATFPECGSVSCSNAWLDRQAVVNVGGTVGIWVLINNWNPFTNPTTNTFHLDKDVVRIVRRDNALLAGKDMQGRYNETIYWDIISKGARLLDPATLPTTKGPLDDFTMAEKIATVKAALLALNYKARLFSA